MSIVIRTKNEGKYLREALSMLFRQSFMAFEIVVVDNCLEDSTLEILQNFPIREVITIKPEDFNHAYSTNLGVYTGRAPLVVSMNGHSIPVSTTWLEDGLSNSVDDMVAVIDGVHHTQSHLTTTTISAPTYQTTY